MKYSFTLILAIAIFSCTTKQNPKEESSSPIVQDTNTITFSKFTYNLEKHHLPYNYTLVRENCKDSLLSFRYTDSAFAREGLYEFLIYGGEFKLITDTTKHDYLAAVDTFEVNIYDKTLPIYKYENTKPVVDAGGGILFSPIFGEIASSSYAWGNKLILSHWNGINIEDEMKSIFLHDSISFLRRHNYTPPPPPSEIQEITLKIEE